MAVQPDLREALKRTAVVLKEAGLQFALTGGYAVWARGGPEPGHDVDFIVAEDDTERAAQVLADAGARIERPNEDWLFKAWFGEAMVDLVHSLSGEPVNAALIAAADELPVLSVRMPVLSATEILVNKLKALSEQSCDLTWALPTARALREQIDWAKVRRETAANPFARAFLYLTDELAVSAAGSQEG